MANPPTGSRQRFEDTHPVLQTRVPQEFYDRVKAEAASRRVSLSKFLVALVDDMQSVSDLSALTDQWKTDGWIECAGWLLAKFRDEGFCNVDLARLTQWLRSEEALWPKVQQAARRFQSEGENESGDVSEGSA